MAIAASALLLVLAVAAYVRHLRTPGVPWLFVMRLAVVVMLALILLDAVVSRFRAVRPKSVALLVDRSLSMTAAGADTQAAAAATGFPVPGELATVSWAMGDTLVRSVGPAAGFERTLVGEALLRVLRERPGAVVLVTDGQDNGEVDPVRVARESGIPVYAVGCGTGGGQNVAATRLSVPVEVYAGDTFGVTGRIAYSGLGGREVTVRLGDGFKKVRLRDEIAEQEFYFRHRFEEPGRRLLRFSVDSMPGESDYADNGYEVTVDVRPSRLRVAYVSDRPGPGVRFATNVLTQDPRVELRPVVRLGAGTVPDVEFLRTAEVVIVDDGVPTQGPVADALAERLRDGVGLLLLAGPETRRWGANEPMFPGEVARRVGTFAPALTGRAQALSWLVDIDYQTVPPFVGALIPDAAASVDVWLLSSSDSVPLVIAYSRGPSRVVYVAGYPLWRWGFGPEWEFGEETPLERFLRGTVRYLAQRKAEALRLATRKPGFFTGERIELTLRARAPDGSAWEHLDVVAVTDSARTGVPMTESEPGVYRVALDAVPPGEHEVVAVVRLDDSVAGRASTGFTVSETGIEMARTGLRPGLLRRIAEASGGRYFRWDSLPDRGFALETGEYRRGFTFDPRRTPWLYILIALVAGAEWVLRRRKGLL